MKNPHPFICDVCKTPKQPSNGWLLGVARQAALTVHRELDEYITRPDAVMLTVWHDQLAEENDVAHLCGLTCSQKWLASATQKLQEKKHNVIESSSPER